MNSTSDLDFSSYELQLIDFVKRQRHEGKELIIEKEMTQISKFIAMNHKVSYKLQKSQLYKQFPFISDISICLNKLKIRKAEDPFLLISNDIVGDPRFKKCINDDDFEYGGVSVFIQDNVIVYCLTFAKINKDMLKRVYTKVLDDIKEERTANIETILQICNDIRFELRIKSIGIQQENQKFLDDHVQDFKSNINSINEIQEYTQQFNGHFVHFQNLDFQDIKSTFEVMLQNPEFINLLLSNARESGLSIYPPSDLFIITTYYQNVNKSSDNLDPKPDNLSQMNSPLKIPKKSRIPISPPIVISPRDTKRKIPVRPPSEETAATSSVLSRKKQILAAQVYAEMDANPPMMAESPALNRPNTIGSELARLVREQRQKQNAGNPNNCPFGDPFADDDDLVVPTCAKEALAQRKMRESKGIYDNPFPPFLLDGNDDDDDLVIPTVAKEFLKQKGLTIEEVRKSQMVAPLTKQDQEYEFPTLTDSSSATASPIKLNSSKEDQDSGELLLPIPVNSSLSDDSDSVMESTQNYSAAKNTPTRKKQSVFASLNDYNFNDQAFQPFQKASSAISNINIPASPQRKAVTKYSVRDSDDEDEKEKVPKLNLKYSVRDSDDEDEKEKVPKIESHPPMNPLELIGGEDTQDVDHKMMLDVKLYDARGNIEMITNGWEQKIAEEKEEGKIRLQQLDAKYEVEMRNYNAQITIKKPDGSVIYRPPIPKTAAGRKEDIQAKYIREKETMKRFNDRKIGLMIEAMQRELERPKAKLIEIEKEYEKYGYIIPPPREKHVTRPRRNTSRIAPRT
ncbi:hypothetical protein TVAG_497100 [Trichomonas vaginalis G3]|uniref:Uncharacterized protein n=1 Tax=Trichomonas vaginalis (strain ATCC PRA-98 / G3) TaxID=412133 RepID=A2EGV3_TRIV3|nr:hypothetical protein TVAGG3_0803740 [Trichomonas vaginalis G3]EAY08087.1 hypothetical protein TVAG_497100 [Trichomonas vaginalis G3]KAI5496698.1 hypothetical protein TVAGG3_0803740 [Trichomonas vaginalis G3]|eukprot:XP_001320310.1 hypothetical protein [Trichomonas vaginalis G3]